VVIGGMISATLLTLFVLPILYRWAERRSKPIAPPKAAMIFLAAGIFSLLSTSDSHAQTADAPAPITLADAIARAQTAYPQIRAARLEMDSQIVLKKTAWSLGNTAVFTGGEEIGGDGGVYTVLGFQQQNIDVFGIAPHRKLQRERIALARAALDLSQLELEYEVKRSYGTLYVARRQYALYTELDSVFADFERAAKLRYETQATSKLAYLAASNQARQISIQKEQIFRDYRMALQRLNLWMVSDSLFTVVDDASAIWAERLHLHADSLGNHPLLQVANQQIQVADREIQAAKAGLYPQINLQYGFQEIDGISGFSQFQAGFSIPLFFTRNQGLVQSAKIRQQIAQQNLRQSELELQNEYQVALEAYLKWKTSWEYYEDEALELAKEQRVGAGTAYREGAIDYVTFLQNVKDAMQIEIDAWRAFEQYLGSRFQIEYLISQ
jgi:cobalt-zinc-cadmium resistance protein CzcA